MGSSGKTDGGTAARVFGSFITWMQEKTAPVFVVATANDVMKLPPEMLRKGRFDELFFCDLPNKVERLAIWKIQIRKYGRKPDKYDCERLADLSKDFTGSEIEQAFISAMFTAFNRDDEPRTMDVERAIEKTVPLSVTKAEEIAALRSWAKEAARSATAAEEARLKPDRAISV